MAELSIRNTAARSIRTVSNYTLDDNFVARLNVEIIGRAQYLQTQWERFQENHHVLEQIALENNRDEEIAEHNQLFAEIEGLYLDALARLQERIRAHDQILFDGNSDTEEENERANGNENHYQRQDERNDNELPPEQHDNDVNNIPEQNDNANRENVQPIPNAPLQAENQFGLLMRQIFGGLAGKRENTWGEFDGNLAKWQGFRDAFKASVHDDASIAPVLKFQLLKSSLRNRAAAAMGEWQINDQNYEEAWNWLNELYSRKYQTSKQILWKLVKFQKLEKTSGFLIEKLVNVTQEVIRQLRAMHYPVQHWDCVLVHTIHDKLDSETSKNWELHRKSDDPTTKDILDFLIQHGRALSSAYSFERSSNSNKRNSNGNERPFENKKKKFESNSSSNAAGKPSTSFQGKKCRMLCDDSHPLYKCPKFLNFDLKSRRAKVRDFNLCFNCLSPDHQVQACAKEACRRCDTKHNSVLCQENPKNKSVNMAQVKRPNHSKNSNKKNRQQKPKGA